MKGLAFLSWLLLEVATIAFVVRSVGVGGTVLAALGTSIAGYLLIRGEGIALAHRFAQMIRRAERTGELPPLPLADAVPRFLAGLLLICPGFANDAIALLLLVPPLRTLLVNRVRRAIVKRHHAFLRERGMADIRVPRDPFPGPGELEPEEERTPSPEKQLLQGRRGLLPPPVE